MTLTGLIFRLIKGSPLTSAEGDSNLRKIRDFCNALAQLFGVVLNPNGTLKDGAVGSSGVLADGVVTAAKLAADAKHPPGAMSAFGGTSIPSGWLECNGALVSRTVYANLFAAIGTAWGVGDGSTTFNLPDMTRRVPVGRGGSGSAVLGNSVGNTGGEENHTLTADESGLPEHSHTSWDNALKFGGGTPDTADDGTNAQIGTFETDNAGPEDAADAHNNIQPSAIVTWIIKT